MFWKCQRIGAGQRVMIGPKAHPPKKQQMKEILAKRSGKLSSRLMKTVVKSPNPAGSRRFSYQHFNLTHTPRFLALLSSPKAPSGLGEGVGDENQGSAVCPTPLFKFCLEVIVVKSETDAEERLGR